MRRYCIFAQVAFALVSNMGHCTGPICPPSCPSGFEGFPPHVSHHLLGHCCPHTGHLLSWVEVFGHPCFLFSTDGHLIPIPNPPSPFCPASCAGDLLHILVEVIWWEYVAFLPHITSQKKGRPPPTPHCMSHTTPPARLGARVGIGGQESISQAGWLASQQDAWN